MAFFDPQWQAAIASKKVRSIKATGGTVLKRTVLVMILEHSKDLPEKITDLVGGRAYTLTDVEDVTVKIVDTFDIADCTKKQ